MMLSFSSAQNWLEAAALDTHVTSGGCAGSLPPAGSSRYSARSRPLPTRCQMRLASALGPGRPPAVPSAAAAGARAPAAASHAAGCAWHAPAAHHCGEWHRQEHQPLHLQSLQAGTSLCLAMQHQRVSFAYSGMLQNMLLPCSLFILSKRKVSAL